MGAGPHALAAGVGEHQRRTMGRDDGRYLGIDPAPGIVDDIGPGGEHRVGHLSAIGVDRDRQVPELGTEPFDEGHHAPQFLAHGHLTPRCRLDPTDVDEVSPPGDGLSHPRIGGSSSHVAPLS